MKKWKCIICSEIVEGSNPPEFCPVCKAASDKFVEINQEGKEFKTLSEDKILILGGGIAGLTAAEAVRKRNPVCGIEIVSDEAVFCYSRPMLTKGIFSDLKAEDLFVKDYGWYEKNKVRLSLGVKAVEIDRENKIVKMEDGSEKRYDKLIYALGAEGNIPPIKGWDKKNVKAIRKLHHVNEIKEIIDEIQDVVVIGGGILGLEAAWEMTRAGKDVTILEVGPRIMGRQLDDNGAMILLRNIEKRGGKVVSGISIEEISGEEKASAVVLADGQKIKADLVIVSAGNRANVQLAEAAGLEVDRLVVVDEKLQTSDPDIFACGDVAVSNGFSVGIWPQALAMGEVAGANAAGDDVVYQRVIPANFFEGFGIQLFSIGDVGTNPEKNYKILEVFDGDINCYKVLYFDEDVLCGGILLGDTSAVEILMEAYKNGAKYGDEELKKI